MIETAAHLATGFRQAMRRVASTVNVISICVDGEPMGITATAVAPVSMDPPSLLVCINQAAAVHGRIEDASHFEVNVLHRDQERDRDHVRRSDAARSRASPRAGRMIARAPPRLLGAQATLLCRRTEHHRFGTHSIFIGVVEEVIARPEVDPLVYLDGRYGGAAT